MARTASDIITDALQIAKCPGFTAQGLRELNSLSDHIAKTIDFSAARGVWNFTFNTALTTAGGGGIISAGPNPLPMDYLRVPVSVGSSGAQRSSKWYFQGVPYDMIELDLTEWDDQVQQAGIQSYPYFWAKDMAQRAVVAETVGDLDSNTATVTNVASLTGITVGMSIAGGIGPLSIVVPGTTILAATPGSPNTLTLSQPPAPPAGQARLQLAAASLTIGYPAQGYPYPPPSGAYPVMIRYQRTMPRLTQAQVTAGAHCWFDDDMVLVEGLAGLMMRFAGDDRAIEYIGDGLGQPTGRFNRRLAQYLRLADDNSNRAQTVTLDRRRFGGSFATLKTTKLVGW